MEHARTHQILCDGWAAAMPTGLLTTKLRELARGNDIYTGSERRALLNEAAYRLDLQEAIDAGARS